LQSLAQTVRSDLTAALLNRVTLTEQGQVTLSEKRPSVHDNE